MISRLLRRFRFPALIFAALTLTGCSSAQLAKDVTEIVAVTAKASQWISNATLWLDRGQALEQAYFQSSPNAATQAALEKKIDDARALLLAVTDTISGTADLTDLDVVNAFKNFVAAALEIDQLLKDIGVIRSTSALASSAVSPAPLELPLCVQAAQKVVSK